MLFYITKVTADMLGDFEVRVIWAGPVQSLGFLKAENFSRLWSEKDVIIKEGSEKCAVPGTEEGGRGCKSKNVVSFQKQEISRKHSP